MQGSGVSQNKLTARIAASRFADLLKGPTIIESSSRPTLFERGRAAAIALAGVAAVAGASLPAAAASLPDRDVANAFMSDINAALEASPDVSRIKSVTMRPDAKIGSNYRADVTSNGIIPLPTSDQTCTVSFAPEENLRRSYSEFLSQVPSGGDLSAIPQMHGTSLCFARARLEEGQLAAFDRTKVGLAPVAEMMTVVASLKYGQDVYEQVVKVEASAASAMLGSSNEAARRYGLSKLNDLGSFHRYVLGNPNLPKQVKDASPEKLLDVALSVVASSHRNLSQAPEVATATLKGISPQHAVSSLRLLGLDNAALGARIAEVSGLLKEYASVSAGTLDGIVPNARLGRGQNYATMNSTEVSAAFSIPMVVAEQYGLSVKENLDYAFGYDDKAPKVASEDGAATSRRRF